MLMKRHANYRTLQTIQRYGEDLIETILDYDKSTGRVTIGNTKQEREAHSIEEMLIDFLTNQTEPVTEKVIKDGIEGRNILKRRALQDLIKQQEIVKIGKGGRKDPYRYYYSQNVACSQHESLLQNLPQNEPSKDPEIEPKNLLQILLEKGHEKNHEQEPREQPNNDAKNSSSRVPTLGREQQNNNTKTAANPIGCSYGSVPVFGNFKPSRELQKLSGNLAEIRGKTLLEKVGITLSSKTTGKTTGITDDIPEVEFAEEVKTNV